MYTPGPTKYNPKDKSNRLPSWTISQERRKFDHIRRTNYPSLGSYNIKSLIGEGPKFTFRTKLPIDGLVKEKRHRKAYKKLEVPGPGKYDIKTSPSGPRYTIGIKRYLKAKNDKSPCVGSYNLTSDKDLVVPCVRFSQGERDDILLNKTALKYPSVGKYRYETETLSTKSPKWTFSKLGRFENKSGSGERKETKGEDNSEGVGPGSYPIPSSIGEGPKYSFPKDKYNHADPIDERNLERSANSPGPDSYIKDIKYMPSSPFYTISKLTRPELSKSLKNEISPMSYTPNITFTSKFFKNPTWSMGKVEKEKKTTTFEDLGPGKYDVKNDTFPQGPKYTMQGRKVMKPQFDNLGPGKYNVVNITFPKEPAYSISKLDRDDDYRLIKKWAFPGPQNYNIKDSKVVQDITFSKNERAPKKKGNFPGPGHYKIPTSFDYINDMARNGGAFNPVFKYV